MAKHPPAHYARVRELILDRLAAVFSGEPIPQGPDLAPCGCTHPRHEHAGKAREGRCTAAGCGCTRYRFDVAHDHAGKALEALEARVTDTIAAYKTHLREQARKNRPPRQPGEFAVSPSNVTSCRREIWYLNVGQYLPDFRPDPVDERAAIAGEVWHEQWVRADAWAHPWREHELEVRVPGLHSSGRIDAYDGYTAEVIDLKTAGEWKWEVIGPDGPEERVWWQPMIYALALIRAGKPVWTVRLIYIRRANGEEEHFVRPYDEDVAMQALEWLIDIVSALDRGEVLPRDRVGPGIDKICDRCFARTHCWDLERATEVGRSPQSWVALGADPKDRDIAKIAAAYDAQRTAKGRHEKAQKLFAAMLEGIPYGNYDGWVYRQRTSHRRDDAKRIEQLEAELPVPDGLRLTADQLDEPKKAVDSIVIERERAAKRAARKGGPKAVTTVGKALEEAPPPQLAAPPPRALEGTVVHHPSGTGDAA